MPSPRFTVQVWVVQLEGKVCDAAVFRTACQIRDDLQVVGPRGKLVTVSDADAQALDAAIRPWLGLKPSDGVLSR